MQQLKKFVSGLVFSSLLAATAVFASGEQYYIHNAAVVTFTPKGMDYFRTHVAGILKDKGVEINDRTIPLFQYEAKEAISLNHLPEKLKKFQGTLNFIRSQMREWLIGFDLHDPKLKVQIKDIKLHASYQSMSVRADEELTASLGQGNGVGIVLEVVIPEFKMQVSRARAQDVNNSILGLFGVNNVYLELNDSKPIKIQVPIRAAVMPGGQVQLEALQIATNLAAVKFRSGFDRPLLLPKVQVRVNDKTMTLETKDIEHKLAAKTPELVAMAQRYLAHFMETELPSRITDMMIKASEKDFTFKSMMIAPGQDLAGVTSKFEWGLKPANLSLLSGGILDLDLNGFIRDVENTWSTPSVWAPKSRPAYNLMPATDYDFGMAINLKLVNEALRLAYERGNFDEMVDNCGNSQALRMTKAPVFYMTGQKDMMRMHLRIKRYDEGIKQKLFLENPFEIELDIYVKVTRVPTGLRLVLDHVDNSTFSIDNTYVRFDVLKGKVMAGVRDAINKLNDDRCIKGKIIADSIAIPNNLFGVPIEIKDIQMDNAGYWVLYMNLGEK